MNSGSVLRQFLRVESGGNARVPAAAVILTVMLAMFGVGPMLASAQSATSTATAGACPAGTPTSGSQNATLCVEIGEYDIYFNPNLITIPADTPVSFVLVNHGATTHDFTITDHKNPGLTNLNISVTTQAGQTSQTTINAPAGTYYFYCAQPGHEQAGMYGYLTVQQGAKITTSDATVTPRAG